MRMIFRIFLFGVVIASMTACGGNKKPPKVTPPPAQTETTSDTDTSGSRADGTVTIFGSVSLSDGSPTDNYTVRIYKKGMRSEEQLGSAITDSRGRYSVSYASDRTPNTIVAKVYYRTEQVASSEPVHNVSEDTIINVIISSSERESLERGHEGNNVEVERVIDTISDTVHDVIRN